MYKHTIIKILLSISFLHACRFCSEKYYPFKQENINKYVVTDDFIPPWNIPSLNNTFNNLRFTKKEALMYQIQKDGKIFFVFNQLNVFT